ncbi:zf-UBP-domain-containing protein [Laetiporus sulphureus 93-53]|uniref:Zf-UBP-domain-containing protein n=1 Tax=Laetiporus sulphureus 93-53 TaxID=1314785 RepID=A0A165E0W8_9APHY|nr:zf-UBP-domain-containing protein [Laetiporus sulphureus 93-53]KZT06033.1 zf-UBP-domain-containing protein [Laetiporus sulphureus 93-53]
MRNYHIRISLRPPSPPAPTNSTSYTPPSVATPATYIPHSLFQTLPSHRSQTTARRYTLTNDYKPEDISSPSEPRDYRFGPIKIDWVDCTSGDMNGSAMKKTGVGKEKERGRGDPVTASFVPHTQAGDKSGFTNLPEGIVHIYRDVSKPIESLQGPSSAAPPNSEEHSPTPSSNAEHNADQDACSKHLVLGVLAVPSWMTPSDFLAFVAPAAEGISHLRMIRDSAPNRSIVVLKFREASEAAEFAEAYNGRAFNSMESEICHVVRILSIAIDTDDPASQTFARIGTTQEGGDVYELPTCPVCLERMDSAVTGLVTVPCSHTFHCTCLSKWGDSRCPVCRYSQTLLTSHPPSINRRSSHPIPFSFSSTPSHCVDCGSTSNLWICLVCGNVGCGRYGRAHAHAHYMNTTHLYALELETQRVWDYAGDGYVHRLIQNKADGKLVELPSAASTIGSRGDGSNGVGPSAADALSAEKIEAIGIEYSYLLTSQLDSQRAFYEEQTAGLRTQVDQLRGLVEQLSQQVERSREDACEKEALRRAEEDVRASQMQAEILKAQKRAEKAAELTQRLKKELQEEHAVSKGLMENLQRARQQTEQAEREKAAALVKVRELEDEMRDVMFFLEARDKIESGDGVVAEAAGGSIELPPSSITETISKGGTHKNKGKRK